MTTTDHTTIKKWTEARDGKPAVVESNSNNHEGALSIQFGEDSEELKEVSWEEFFVIFDEEEMWFEYEEEHSDKPENRSFKFRQKS